MTAITPPVFGVRASAVGDEPNRAVALVVPASIDGPHLIQNGQMFQAPLRVNADTHWMKERVWATFENEAKATRWFPVIVAMAYFSSVADSPWRSDSLQLLEPMRGSKRHLVQGRAAIASKRYFDITWNP